MNTHSMARNLAFYRASAPPHIGGPWDDFKKATGIPDSLADKIEAGAGDLMQLGFDTALDELIKLVTGDRYNLRTVKSAPYDVRRAIVAQAAEVSEGLGRFAQDAILGTPQDLFYAIAGQFLTPKYNPDLNCCTGTGKKSYAQVLELLKRLSTTVKNQIVVKCYEKSKDVGDYAKAHLELNVPEPNLGDTPVKQASPTQTEKLRTALAALEIRKRGISPGLIKAANDAYERTLVRIPPVLLTPEGRKWMTDWQHALKLTGPLTDTGGGNKKKTQKQKMSTGMKWTLGILGAATIAGVVYLAMDD